MLTRAVAVLITAAALTASIPGGARGAAAQTTVSEAPPAGCGPAGYPAAYGIWCPGSVHLVVHGDNLWNLAQYFLGSGRLWPDIYVLGRGRPRPCAPAEIIPGQILLIPPPGAGHGTGQAARPGSCPPARGRGTPSASVTPSASATPSPRPSATRSSQPAPRPPATPAARRRAFAAPGWLLPVILAGLGAAAITGAASALVRRRRPRHRRRRSRIMAIPEPGPAVPHPVPAIAVPGPFVPDIPGDHEEDPDDPYGPGPAEGAEPGTTGLSGPRAWSGPLAAPPAGPSRPRLPAPADPGPALPAGHIPLGIRYGREITADVAAMGGLGLTGPGAPAAARAILAALLTQARSDPQELPAPVIVPADAARLLLAPAPQDGSGVPGLSQPASLTAALDELEALILRRARLAQGPGDEDSAPRVTPAGPTAALIAVSGHADTGRLRSIAATAKDLGITLVVLGEWPHGVTCHVAADGVITAAAPPDSGLDGIRLRRFTPGDLSATAGLVSAPAGAPPEDDPATLTPHPPARHTSGAASPAVGSPLRGRAPAVPELSHDRPPPVPAPDVPVAGEPGSSKGSWPVRIGVLGPLQITAADREIGRGPRKARELLAFLAVHGADGATADAISEALWPGAPPGYGTRQRNVALRKARDLLRTSTGRSAPMWITHTAGRYRLDPSLIEVDLWQFQAALDAARTASTDQDRLAAYRQATGCYRGPLCDGAGYDWAEPHTGAARHRALDAWAHIAGILQDTDPEQALAVMETALTHDPYNEYTYQRIMRLQAAAGRTDAVRRTLELLQSRLAELGISTLRASTRQAVAALLGDSGPCPRPAGHPPAATSTGKPSSAGDADRPRPPRPTRTRLPAIRRDR